DWRSFFTLRGSGKLDVNTASAEVLAAVTGASLSNAEQLVARRNGLDEMAQTEDDLPIESVEEAMHLLGIGGGDAQEVAGVLTLAGQTKRIESLGVAGDVRCGIAVILNGGGQGIAEWKEFSLEDSPTRL
ncbi:MAG TPA: type II secretion system protein GspK, partial [Prosthecobacter sp.]